MTAFLDELEAQPRRARRIRWLAGLAAGLVTLAGAGIYIERARSSLCLGANEHLAGIWDDGRRAALRGAFGGSGHAAAAGVAARLEAVINGYTGRWVAMRTEVCQATHLRGEQSEKLLDLRMGCLDRRLSKLDATVQQLVQEPSAALVDESVEIAHGLPDLRACANREALLGRMPPPQTAAARQSVAALRRRIDEAEAQLGTGRLKEGVAAATAIAQEVEAADYPPLVSEAYYLLGRLQIEAGEYADSEASLERGLRAASTSHDDVQMGEILTQLAYTTGGKQERYDAGHAYGLAAEAAITRAGNDERQRAALLQTLGTISFFQGDIDKTREAIREALLLREALDGPEHPGLGAPLNILGNTYSYQGKAAEAHPYYERALAVREKAYGGDHPTVASALDSLGLNAFTLGRYAEARRLHERAAEIIEARLGPDNVRLSGILHNLGNALIEQGEGELALANFVRATQLRLTAHGPDSPRVAVPMTGQGDALLALRRYPEAIERYRGAIEIFESKLGADHLFIGFAKMGLGRAQLGLGETTTAIATLTTALTIMEAGSQDAVTLAQIRFPLARALWQIGREKPRALALARQAGEAYRDGGPASAKRLAEVEAWLAERSAL